MESDLLRVRVRVLLMFNRLTTHRTSTGAADTKNNFFTSQSARDKTASATNRTSAPRRKKSGEFSSTGQRHALTCEELAFEDQSGGEKG